MNSPYLASRNHSSRFSRAASAGFRPCATTPTPITANATTKTRSHEENKTFCRLMSSSEVESERHLHDARIARRGRLAEVRVHLIARRVEPGPFVDVLELKRVQEVVGLDAEL